MELISKAASILLLPIMVCVGCANNDLDGLEDAVVLQRWLESTGDPVLGATLPCYEPVDTLLSPEVAGYEYYFIESFVIDSNRVYISDGRMNTLLAFSHDGAMLWKTGGTGEGPGLFSNIGQLAVSGDTVAACNMASSRVDLFSATDGHWLLSIPVYWPFDVEFLPNGNLVVQGSQEVRVNSENRVLQVGGVVRPQDIRSTNEVPHDRLAEARISYGGRGQITDVQRPRWGQEVFDILFPF